ncbi:MAG: hypothetical protein AAFW95_12610 [Cyanobacteria bacterium J06638_6]
MANNYGAFAAITVDAAGTEHAIWEHQGSLWYTYFDEVANQWVEAEPVGNASGGRDLQLLYGETLLPAKVNGSTIQVPALIALWDDRSGNLFYALGRYTSTGQVEWSDQIEFGQPISPTGEDLPFTVLSQNPQATFSIGAGGTNPRVIVAYEILNTAFTANTTWTGTDDNGNSYTVRFKDLTGTDNNGDGIISGRSPISTLGDGVTNELTAGEMIVEDSQGNILAAYPVGELQGYSGFNLNIDPNTNRVLANADADAFSLQNGTFGLSVGLGENVVPVDEDLWLLESQAASDQILLQETKAGQSEPTQIATSGLGSGPFTFTSDSGFDDTDVYFEQIRFGIDTDGTIKDQGGQGTTVTFNPATPLPPQYVSPVPTAQFLTADAVEAASTNTDPLFRDESNTYLYETY